MTLSEVIHSVTGLLAVMGFALMVIQTFSKKNGVTYRVECRLVKLLATMAALIAFLTLIGYAFKAQYAYYWFGVQMAPNTAVSLLFLAVGQIWTANLVQRLKEGVNT